MLEQQQRRRVGPVDVVEDEQQGLTLRDRRQPAFDGLEEPQPLGLRLARGRGAGTADAFGHLGEEAPDVREVLADVGAYPRRRARRRVCAEGLAETLERREMLLFPTTEQHRAAGIVRRLCH